MKRQVLLILDMHLEESAAILKGVNHYKRSHGVWDVQLDDRAQTEMDPHWIRNRKWDGVISRHVLPGLAQDCVSLGIPLVDLHEDVQNLGVAKIRPDNVAVGHLGAEYFLERRYRHFGFFGVAGCHSSRERCHGFLEALGLAGQNGDVFEGELCGDSFPGWDAHQIARIAGWLRVLSKPAAIMACDDRQAQLVVRAARAAGLNVPEQVAVLGANNNIMQCELSEPSISSVVVNTFQAGWHAAEYLDQLMAGKNPTVLDLRIEPQGVVTRKSTDVMALRDRDVAKALTFIEDHACEGLTVDAILQHTLVSRSKLEYKFRYYIGRSPQAEIRRIQVNRIKQLLVETDQSLKEIADQVGIQHVEYMSVMFKRLTGEPPGQYRRKNQISARERIFA